ncbi:hypothetical protein M0R45_013400 [Rubus argutus]|uniref:Uncharacterized protein n=1 Tax=Rubus argutus TaxID=59490 RepID=A0AAW1XJC5_RUBAR
MAPEYHHPSPPGPPFDAHGAKRKRKTVDYTSTVVRYTQNRMWQSKPAAYSDNPSSSFAAKFERTCTNKLPTYSINRVLWTPCGRRLITGSQNCEFTLWNGQSFKVEMNIRQAHDRAIRSMAWSHSDIWISGDDGGSIKYWQTNMNNVKANKSAHKESVRDLSFCKTGLKFCSCSDDIFVKIWDFERCQEERTLRGHGWDVKCVDWHPTKSLLASGGKDSLVKLWDARSGRELCSFHGHKNSVRSVKWNQNGNWLLSASKDQVIKLYDIRAMKEVESFRGHRKEVTALAWHPFQEEYFASGSSDGSIFHWVVGHETPRVEIANAHDNSVWDLQWHPIGHVLCSGSNDRTTKFWCRNRPGDTGRNECNISQNQGYGDQNSAFAQGRNRNEGITIPGVGVAMPLAKPSLNAFIQGEQQQPHAH